MTVFFYCHEVGDVLEGETVSIGMPTRLQMYPVEVNGKIYAVSRGDAFATREEAQKATKDYAQNGIKVLQTILDNLKDDTDQMD